MKEWKSSWKKSKSIRKKKKYVANAPLHIKQKMMAAHLSKDLRKKYGTRSMGVRKGDEVKIVRGDLKGKKAKVIKCDLQKRLIFLDGIQISRRDGTKVNRQIVPSNVIILDLNLEDKKRKKALERKSKK